MISILITNYNKSKFLKQTLRSIQLNKRKKYEIILFDDVSTDNSLEIIKKFRNIKLIRNKKKIYRSSALNQIHGILECFKISKGNIICLLDGDDRFTKNKLNLVYKKLNKKKY